VISNKVSTVKKLCFDVLRDNIDPKVI